LQAGARPDILVNTGATIDYTASTGEFVYLAKDRTITYADGTEDYLTGTGFKTTFTLKGYVDSTGKWTGGIAGYDMVEEVTEGTVTIKGVTYGIGTILLAGDVMAFGWDNVGTPSVPKFDFLVNNLSGVLTTQIALPDLPWPTGPPTGIIATGESGLIDWSSDFSLTEMKGDKFPTPEPGTLILMGTGLASMAGYAKLRLKRRKKA
jgi:hypothetical protein